MKKMISRLVVLVMAVNMLGIAVANHSDNYSVRYVPGGAPGNQQIDYTYVSYYSDWWLATCSSFSGVNGSMAKVTGSNGASITAANGYSYVNITSTGNSVKWHVNGNNWSSGDTVAHKVAIENGLYCIASGLVKHDD